MPQERNKQNPSPLPARSILNLSRFVGGKMKAILQPFVLWARNRPKIVGSILLLILALAFALAETRTRIIIVRPLEVPEGNQLSVSGSTIANLLADEFRKILRETRERAEARPATGGVALISWMTRGSARTEGRRRALTLPVLPTGKPVSVGIEYGGISIDSILSILRRWRGNEERISGDVFFEDDLLQIVIRSTEGGPWDARMKHEGVKTIRRVCRLLAEAYFSDAQPSFLAIYYLMSNRSAEAAEILETVTRREPMDSGGYVNLGLAYHLLNNWDEAIWAFEKAIKLDEDNIRAYNNLGITHFFSGEGEKAEADFKRAISIDPDIAELHFNLGSLYERQVQYKDAIDAFAKARTLDPNDAKTLNSLGLCWKGKGDLEKAIQHYRQAIDLDRRYFGALWNLAVAYVEKEEWDEAAWAFKKATQVEPTNPEAQFQLAAALELAGKLDEAADAYKNTLAVNPEDAEAKERLEELRKLSGLSHR